MTTGMTRLTALAAALLFGNVAAPLAAQLANPIPAAGGMADNYTAVARGYAAVAWNPAALGLSDGPQASALIGAVRGLAGMGPVTISELVDYEGRLLPLDVRQRWLADIRREGGQAGAAGFDVTWAGFQAGRFAAQVSTSARSVSDISPGMAELILFGNADEQGNARALEFDGSVVDANMYSTAALSFGMPLPTSVSTRIALGVTAKYVLGHAVAVSEPSRGRSTSDPITMDLSFPIAYTPVVYDGDNYWIRAGGGFGVDVAATMATGPWVVAAVVQNVLNTFEWDYGRMRYRPLELVFSEATVETASEWEPMANAPPALRELVDDATFRPTLSVGAAFRQSAALMVAADARVGSTRGMATRPPVHAGAGVEVQPLSWLPLQAGAAYVSLGEGRSGVQLAAGAGVRLGTFLISGSATRRSVGLGGENMLMVSLLSHTF
jgi:hypothetical protein